MNKADVRREIKRHFQRLWGPRDLETIRLRRGEVARWVNLAAWGLVCLGRSKTVLPVGKYLVHMKTANRKWVEAALTNGRVRVPRRMKKPRQKLRGKRRRVAVLG